MIRTLRRVSGILPLTRWLTDSTASVVVFVPFLVLSSIHDAVHVAVGLAIRKVVLHAKARPPACTTTLTLVVSCERISASESAATLEARVWPFACV
jgi:hypothetical protein